MLLPAREHRETRKGQLPCTTGQLPLQLICPVSVVLLAMTIPESIVLLAAVEDVYVCSLYDDAHPALDKLKHVAQHVDWTTHRPCQSAFQTLAKGMAVS